MPLLPVHALFRPDQPRDPLCRTPGYLKVNPSSHMYIVWCPDIVEVPSRYASWDLDLKARIDTLAASHLTDPHLPWAGP